LLPHHLTASWLFVSEHTTLKETKSNAVFTINTPSTWLSAAAMQTTILCLKSANHQQHQHITGYHERCGKFLLQMDGFPLLPGITVFYGL
jgi:hypothetical protein